MAHKIIRLIVENYKRLKAADVSPRGNVVIVASKKNEEGKSSLLDSIQNAFGGEKVSPKKPIRTGQEQASVDIDLGDLRVRRTFDQKGGTIVVTNAEGLKYPSPQGVCDAMYNKVAFDPFEFARLEQPQQNETLRKLVGLDFKEHDQTRQMIYDKRREEGRELRSLEARLQALKFTDGLPDQEETTEEILKQQTEAARVNASNAEARNGYILEQEAYARQQDTLNGLIEKRTEIVAAIERLQEQLRMQEGRVSLERENLKLAEQHLQAIKENVDQLKDQDLTPFQDKAKQVEDRNRLIRANNSYLTVKENLQAKKEEIDDYTKRLDAMDADKAKQLREAKYPIEGLTIDADGEMLYTGVPFSQASSAARIRVSVAIGMALNPDLRVLIIREGSLLDDDNLAVITEMAEKQDCQVWIETLDPGADVAVIIEDGKVVGGTAMTTEEEKKVKSQKAKPVTKPKPEEGKLL